MAEEVRVIDSVSDMMEAAKGVDLDRVAVKHDDGKMGFEFLPPDALSAINDVFRFGAKKYAPHNWEKGFAWTRLINAAFRHLFAYATGEDRDPESGLSHLTHLGFCVLTLLAHEIRGLGNDDRPKRETQQGR